MDDTFALRDEIGRALIRIGEAAIPALVPVLTNGQDGQRRAAAHALREMSANPQATTAFYAVLRDPDPQVRELAVEAIALPHNGLESPYQDDSSSPNVSRDDPAAARALLPLLDDPVERVRAAARNGLRAVGGPDDVALLERARRFSRDMAEGGGTLFSAETATYLRLLARAADGGLDPAVWRAAQVLSHLGPHGLAALRAVLHDPDLYTRTIRIWAIDALGASDDARAVPPLLDALRDAVPDSSVEGYVIDRPEDRRLGEELRAAYALARLGEPGVAALVEVSRDANASERTRWAARDALESLSANTGTGVEPPAGS